MRQTWEGLLVDRTLLHINFDKNKTCWDEIKELKERLAELMASGASLAVLVEPMEVYTLERALRGEVDLYRLNQRCFIEWAHKNGSPHLKKVLA